jgi:putative NAD(P)-binding protein
LNGSDAVVSSLGTGLSPFREVSLLTVATGALVTAMTRNGVRRLVCISALGVEDSRGHGRFVFGAGCSCLCCSAMLTRTRTLRKARSGQLIRLGHRPAAMLTNDPARRSVRAVTDLAGLNGGKIARAHVARFVVEQPTTDTWLRRTPVILW